MRLARNLHAFMMDFFKLRGMGAEELQAKTSPYWESCCLPIARTNAVVAAFCLPEGPQCRLRATFQQQL